MPPVFVRSDGNYDMMEASNASGLLCEDPTLAQQQFKEETDLNTILERFRLTGEVPQLQSIPGPQDYEGIFDFQDAMNAVRAANEQFMTLPAKLRERFDNTPQKFLEFCSDEENRPEMVRLGLIEQKPEQKLDATPTPAPAPAPTPNP